MSVLVEVSAVLVCQTASATVPWKLSCWTTCPLAPADPAAVITIANVVSAMSTPARLMACPPISPT
jgi:hypothetical protein